MEGRCIVSGCGKAASKCCGSCGFVRYCSVECQKKDWKKHHKKFECVNMKKLSAVSLTEVEINQVTHKIAVIPSRLSANGEHERNIDLLKECIDFVQDHLGRLDRKDSHSIIGGGVKPNNFSICRLLVKLGKVYYNMPSSSETDNHALSYISEARELLVQRKDAGKDDSDMWEQLSICDTCLYHLCLRKCQLQKAKYHAVQFVASARQYKGPDKADHLIAALSLLSEILQLLESNCPEALAVAEESYLIASKHYSPAHTMVLKASRNMIKCLIDVKDYSTADTYCRMNFANVFDPKNAGEYDAVDRVCTMNQLVDIWLEKEPDDDEIVEKALADEAIDLSRRMYALSEETRNVQITCDRLSTLCQVLLKANKLTEETEGLLHQLAKTFTSTVFYDGPTCIRNLGVFYLGLQKSIPIGEKSTLLQENIEVCEKKLLEIESCNDGSVGYIKGSQKIKPYFKNNTELCI